MSHENVGLIERGFDALNRRDVEGAKALADPDCELRTRFTGLGGETYRGHPGVESWFADVAEAWSASISTSGA